jgi:xylulose-5-phosphate/fructose-6-phosphate phosphoketolase
MEAAVRHCAEGAGIRHWAGNTAEAESPDAVLVCAGDVPTLEVLAAITVLRQWAPELQIRVTLEKSQEDPHGLDDEAFERIFTSDKPIIMAFHGYPAVVHKLTYNRRNHANFHVHGFRGEGTNHDTIRYDRIKWPGSI